jgi:tetratricopeptide (TPR) repeat protein
MIYALAALLRLLLWSNRDGALWFEEDLPLQLGFALHGLAGGRIDLDPHYPFWPHLSFYVFLLVQGLQFLIGRALGLYASPADFLAAATLDPNHLRGPAMLAEVAIGLLCVWAGSRLARIWVSPAAASWVGLALALSPLYIRHSLVISPDMLMTLFVTLALTQARHLGRHGGVRDALLAGLWLGLGVAAKYPALFVLPSLSASLSQAPRDVRERWRFAAAISSAAAIAFVATSPYSLRDIAHEQAVPLGLKVFAGERLGLGAEPALASLVLQELPSALGWPLWVACALASAFVAFTKGRDYLPLLAFVIPYALVVAFIPNPAPRYLLPLLPPLLALAAAAWQDVWSHPPARPVLRIALVAAMIGMIGSMVMFVHAYTRPDTRALARSWCLENVPNGALVASEYLSAPLPRRPDYQRVANLGNVSSHRRELLQGGPSYWLHDIPFSVQTPTAVAPFYDPAPYLSFDWIVLSGAVRARYAADPGGSASQLAFYEAVDRYFVSVYRTPTTGAVGPQIAIHRPPRTPDSVLATWAGRGVVQTAGPAWSEERIADVFSSRAQLLWLNGRAAAAADDWRRALAWKDAPSEWWYQFGRASLQLRNFEQAREAFSRAYGKDPRLVEPGLSWAATAARLQRWEESTRVLDGILSRNDISEDVRLRARRLADLVASYAADPRKANGPTVSP